MHQQEVLALFSQIALATADLDIDSFMNEAATFLARTLDVEYAQVLEFMPSAKTLAVRAGYGWKKSAKFREIKVRSDSRAVLIRALFARRTLVVERDLVGSLPNVYRSHGVKSGMAVVIPGTEPYGILGVFTKTPRSFSQDDTNFFQSFANILALVLDRRSAESELRRFRYMADNANIGISLIDEDGYFKYANRITFERLGYTQDEYMKKQVVHQGRQGSAPRFKNLFRRVQREEMQPFETFEMTKDGRQIPLEINLTGVTFEGKPYMFAITQDISWRVKAREDRIKNQKNLEFLAEAGLILGSSLEYDKTLDKIASLAISYIADWCAINIIDTGGELELLSAFHKDPRKAKLVREIRTNGSVAMNASSGTPNVIRTGKSELYSTVSKNFFYELMKSPKDAKRLASFGMHSMMIVPLKSGRKTIGAIMFALSESNRSYDENDLKIAEELATRASLAIENARLYLEIEEQKKRLDNIIKNIPGVVWESWFENASSSLKKVDFISDYIEQMTGHTEKECREPGFLESIIHPDDRERTVAEYYQMVKEDSGLIQQFRFIHKRGYEVWVESHSSLIKDVSGKTVGIRGVMMDVSERTKFELRKDEFIGMASHELKTPVTTLKVFTQILENQAKKTGDSNMLLYLSKMDSQVSRLTDLINDLLDLSKIQAGKLSFKYSTFRINRLVQEIVEQLQPAIPTHTLVITGSVDRDVRGDYDRLGQVIINLITNAVKYSPKSDKVDILVSKENGMVVVGVKDYGIGISPEQQQKIFGRFYQATEGGWQTFPGLGIGLYISDQIMRRHSGKITVESVKGKYSIFRMVLPLKAK